MRLNSVEDQLFVLAQMDMFLVFESDSHEWEGRLEVEYPCSLEISLVLTWKT